MKKFRGLGVAMVTPFKASKEIDFEALERITQSLIDGGVDYLVVQGTTGEAATLKPEEKRQVLNTVMKVNGGKLPIVYGVGGNNTAALVETLKTFDFSGVDGILSASPNYNKPTQEGIYQHYKMLAETTDLPIILYNVPGRTASNVKAETTLRLAQNFENIIGVKEASGDVDQVMDIIQGKPADFLVISGEDALTLPFIAAGADGVISVVGNAFPKEYSAMVHKSLDGDFAEARKYHYQLLAVIGQLFADGNPGGVKEALQIKGLCENHLRLPLVPVSSAVSDKLAKLMKERNLMEV